MNRRRTARRSAAARGATIRRAPARTRPTAQSHTHTVERRFVCAGAAARRQCRQGAICTLTDAGKSSGTASCAARRCQDTPVIQHDRNVTQACAARLRSTRFGGVAHLARASARPSCNTARRVSMARADRSHKHSTLQNTMGSLCARRGAALGQHLGSGGSNCSQERACAVCLQQASSDTQVQVIAEDKAFSACCLCCAYTKRTVGARFCRCSYPGAGSRSPNLLMPCRWPATPQCSAAEQGVRHGDNRLNELHRARSWPVNLCKANRGGGGGLTNGDTMRQ